MSDLGQLRVQAHVLEIGGAGEDIQLVDQRYIADGLQDLSF